MSTSASQLRRGHKSSSIIGRLTAYFTNKSESASETDGRSRGFAVSSTQKEPEVSASSDTKSRTETAVAMEESGQQEPAIMSTYYLNHGNPMVPFSGMPLKDFLIGLGKSMKTKPKAILVVSAHWDTEVPLVTVRSKNSTYHDFYGFPSFTYQLRYDAPGAPDLARRIVQLLKGEGFTSIGEDSERGLDHGVWVPLMLMYPNPDIPVVQLSIQSKKDGAYHYKMGQALAPLTKEGVLIIGSGSVIHNMRALRMNIKSTPTWAAAFDDWLTTSLAQKRYDEVIHYEETAPYAKTAHPTPDHFLPLLVALGAAGEDATSKLINHGWELLCFSMACFEFEHVS